MQQQNRMEKSFKRLLNFQHLFGLLKLSESVESKTVSCFFSLCDTAFLWVIKMAEKKILKRQRSQGTHRWTEQETLELLMNIADTVSVIEDMVPEFLLEAYEDEELPATPPPKPKVPRKKRIEKENPVQSLLKLQEKKLKILEEKMEVEKLKENNALEIKKLELEHNLEIRKLEIESEERMKKYEIDFLPNT